MWLSRKRVGVLKEVSLQTRFEQGVATRKRLIDAAIALLISKSFQQTTIDEIAEKARFSKGAFYFHFSNKQAILEALVKYLGELGLLWPPFPEVSSEVGLTLAQLESVVFKIWVEAKEKPEIRELLQSYLGPMTAASLAREMGKLVQHQILAIPA